MDWTKDRTFDEFYRDVMRFDAVVRALEIISEASRGLDPGVKERHPAIDWSGMAGAGNIYRHNYDDVSERRVWDTVQGPVVRLLAAVESELGR